MAKKKFEEINRHHCCATCVNFSINKVEKEIEIKCSRLDFNTKSHYKFNCWEPRLDIKEKIKNKLLQRKTRGVK